MGQSDSGSVRFLKAGPLNLFEFVLIAFALYITACLFKSINSKKKKKKKKVIIIIIIIIITIIIIMITIMIIIIIIIIIYEAQLIGV